MRPVLNRKLHQSTLDDEGQGLALAVVWRETGAEFGYVFNPDYHGRGFATEVTEAMLRLGFAYLGLHRIIGRVDARNEASAKVLTRLGMRHEAHFVQNEFVKGEWTDEAVYAILEHEWKARQAATG